MVEIFHSAEVRWFLRAEPELAGVLLDWFTEGNDICSQKRTDSYLHLPGCESIGVKLREGRFEIKAIRGTTETVRYGSSVTGRASTWVKWSYGKESVDSWIAALRRESGGWIHVKKERWLRKFSLDSEEPDEVKSDVWPDEGCSVELTAVQVGGDSWWTIAFEAFGTAETVRSNLRSVAEQYLSHLTPPTALDTTNSCAYPVWLGAVVT